MPRPSHPPLFYYHNTQCPSYCVPEYRSCHRILGRYGHSIWNSCSLRGHNKRDTPWRRARCSKLLVMCFVHAPDIFFSIVSKVPILPSQRISRNFRYSVMSRLPLVLYYHFTLHCKELLRYEAVLPAALSLLSVCYAHTVFPICSTPKMEAAGLLKNWQMWNKSNPSPQPRSC